MRLFVAAELSAELQRSIGLLQEELRQAPLPIRWVRPEGIHLTLKFLGEVQESRLPEIRAGLERAGRDTGPLRLLAAGVAAFPDRGTPRIIWLEVRGELTAARALAAAIDAAMAQVGFPPETREFRPHLTLGRVKGPGRGDWQSILARAAGRAAGEFEITEYVLFESRLGPGGAAYTPLQRFPLGRTAADGEKP